MIFCKMFHYIHVTVYPFSLNYLHWVWYWFMQFVPWNVCFSFDIVVSTMYYWSGFRKKKKHRLKKIKLTHSNQIKMIKIYTIYILFSGIWFVTFGHLLCWWSRSKNWRGHMSPLYNKRHQKFIIRLKTLVFNVDVFGAELNSSFEICLNFWK